MFYFICDSSDPFLDYLTVKQGDISTEYLFPVVMVIAAMVRAAIEIFSLKHILQLLRNPQNQ